MVAVFALEGERERLRLRDKAFGGGNRRRAATGAYLRRRSAGEAPMMSAAHTLSSSSSPNCVSLSHTVSQSPNLCSAQRDPLLSKLVGHLFTHYPYPSSLPACLLFWYFVLIPLYLPVSPCSQKNLAL